MVVALATLASCGKDGVDVASVLLVSTVEVTPQSGDLVLGGTAQLTAIPKTASGIAIPGRTVVWSSSNVAAVSVSSAGVITALALGGPVHIKATVDGVSGESLITVQPFPVVRVSVAPDQVGIMVGGSTELTATAFDAKGDPLPGRVVFWQSSAPSIAAVTSTGIVLGMSEGGPVTITATAEGKSGTALVSVAPRPATRLSFVQQPGSATAGQPIFPAVRVAIQNDQGGTVTAAANSVSIALSTNPGGATLTGTTTVAAVNGIATFSNLSLDRVGAGYTLTVTSAGLAPATSFTFANVAGPASQLAFTTAPPGTAGSGVPLSPQPVLQLRDGSGNAVGQSGVVVTASIASGTATLSGGATATTNSAGTATFSSLTLNGSGGTLTLAFSAPGVAPVTSGPITLGAGNAVALAMVTQPSSSAASGAPFAQQPVLQLRDISNNPVSQGGVAVTAAIVSGGGTLGGTVTVTTNSSGTATYSNLEINGLPGDRTLSFSGPGLTSVTSNTINVGLAPATQLSVSTQPSSSATSGVAFSTQPTVQLRDGLGIAVGQSGVVVTATIASGGGTLGGATTATTNSSGVALFTNLSISGAPGSRTLGFSAPGVSGATSSAISITAAPATKLSITTQPPSSATSGVTFSTQPVIQLRDASDNPVSQSGVVVTAAIATGGGALGGATTATTNTSGVAIFANLSISGTPGSRTLIFSSGSLASATSVAISVTAAPATQLDFTTPPPATAASSIIFSVAPVIQLENATGGAVSAGGVPVTVSVASGAATLGGTLTVDTDATGKATFTDISLTGPTGSHTLRFTSPGLTEKISGILTLGAGPASKLGIVVQPSATAQSGKDFAQEPAVRILDSAGNPVASSGVTITAAINSGSGTLGGDNTRSTNSSGISTFSDLGINGIGTHTLKFTASSLTQVISVTITVSP